MNSKDKELVAEIKAEIRETQMYSNVYDALRGKYYGYMRLEFSNGRRDLSAYLDEIKTKKEDILQKMAELQKKAELKDVAKDIDKSLLAHYLFDHGMTEIVIREGQGRITPGESLSNTKIAPNYSNLVQLVCPNMALFLTKEGAPLNARLAEICKGIATIISKHSHSKAWELEAYLLKELECYASPERIKRLRAGLETLKDEYRSKKDIDFREFHEKEFDMIIDALSYDELEGSIIVYQDLRDFVGASILLMLTPIGTPKNKECEIICKQLAALRDMPIGKRYNASYGYLMMFLRANRSKALADKIAGTIRGMDGESDFERGIKGDVHSRALGLIIEAIVNSTKDSNAKSEGSLWDDLMRYVSGMITTSEVNDRIAQEVTGIYDPLRSEKTMTWYEVKAKLIELKKANSPDPEKREEEDARTAASKKSLVDPEELRKAIDTFKKVLGGLL